MSGETKNTIASASAESAEGQPTAPKKKRGSIVASLTLWYIGLTIVNIGVFWVGVGSNQMRLIADKATTSARSVAFEILRRIQPFTDATLQEADPAVLFRDPAKAAKFEQFVRNGKPSDLLTNYRILTASAEVVYISPPASKAALDKGPDAKEILDALKALQLKEAKNELFIGVPDLAKREIDLVIPLTSGKKSDLVLMSKLPLQDIHAEISALIRLGIGMVVLLLGLQTGMGFLIYKKFVVPIQNVGAAAMRLAGGSFDQVENRRKKDDEISALIESFNAMSRELKKNRDKMQLELNIARKIQSAILPKMLKAGRLVAHIHYNPLQEVSGDYYDFVELSDGSIAIFIGDASGHGVPAAFITVMAKVYFTSLVEKIESPAALLSAMNERMSAYFSGAGLYLTAFYLRMYRDGRSVYCNAVHPEPIILRADGTTEFLKPSGFYVGMLKKVFRDYKDVEFVLQPGDRIVLYTDGFTEAMNPQAEIYSSERFVELTKARRDVSAEALIGVAVQEIADYQAGSERQDDETLIVVEIGPEQGATEVATETTALATPRALYAYEQDGQFVQALESARALEAKDASLKKLVSRASKSIKTREFYVALACFHILKERHGDDAATHFHMALALYGLKFYDDAEQLLAAALRLDAYHADAHWLTALCAMKKGDTAAALVEIRRATAENPSDLRYQKLMQSLERETA